MRRWWLLARLALIRALGLTPAMVQVGVKTEFRIRKHELQLPEWENLATVFQRTPDLSDYLAIQIENLDGILRSVPITSDGDRQRLVLQSQREVLEDLFNLPVKSRDKIQSMMKAKKVPQMKGTQHAFTQNPS